MADNEETTSGGEPPSPEKTERRRRQAMTPELRRFLGPGRTVHDREEKEKAETESAPVEETPPVSPPQREPAPPRPLPAPQEQPTAPEVLENEPGESPTEYFEPPQPPSGPPPQPTVVPNQQLARKIEMQKVVLILGGLIALGTTFYIGTKASYWKRLIMARNKPELPGMESSKFPGLSADELVEQALAAERIGNWKDAVERFVAAKQRNLTYRGILFRAGKLCYDHGDFDNADKLLERSVAFDDHADTANYLRGLIAVGRTDLSAAERFFEAAAAAQPFVPGYYYYWGEALRRDHRPNDAVRRYEQAAARTASEQDASLCRYKTRLARAEAGENESLKQEIEQKRTAGNLPVDWLLTDAALQIRAGQIDEAARLIGEARGADQTRLFSFFASCTSDMLFTEASDHYPEIAQACRVETKGQPIPSSSTILPGASP